MKGFPELADQLWCRPKVCQEEAHLKALGEEPIQEESTQEKPTQDLTQSSAFMSDISERQDQGCGPLENGSLAPLDYAPFTLQEVCSVVKGYTRL